MMKNGFTLLELLVVIGIMGLLGTASVGGYRQMRRGMETKGVMRDVNMFIRAAYQRAQIDRQPTAVFFWNETLRGENDDPDESAIVVGRAVAVRRSGRITKVRSNLLFDEFADLDLSYTPSGGEDEGEESGSSQKANMFLYPMDDISDMKKIQRTCVETKVYGFSERPLCLSGTRSDNFSSGSSGESSGKHTIYGFKISGRNDVDWKPGKAYGFEFAHIELPHGYIFGSSYKSSSRDPVQSAGALAFDVGNCDGTSIEVYALRQGESGDLSAKSIGKTEKPTEKIQR